MKETKYRYRIDIGQSTYFAAAVPNDSASLAVVITRVSMTSLYLSSAVTASILTSLPDPLNKSTAIALSLSSISFCCLAFSAIGSSSSAFYTLQTSL